MFQSVGYKHHTLDEDGWEHYTYLLTDSTFETMFKVTDRHRYYIIPQMIKIYLNKKQPVAPNIARYYMWNITDYRKMISIVESDYHILSDFYKSYDKYYPCIRQHVVNALWARGFLKYNA